MIENNIMGKYSEMECNYGMEKIIESFEKIQNKYNDDKRFEEESLNDPYGRSPEELKKRYYESRELLQFHDR